MTATSLAPDTPEADGVLVEAVNPFAYAAVPVASVFLQSISAAALLGAPNAYLAAHRAFIVEAAARKGRSPFQRWFAAGVAAYLEEVLERSLPRPGRPFQAGSGTPALADEEPTTGDASFEGALRRVEVSRYERDPGLRKKCLAHHGDACAVCDVRLSDIYGPSMTGHVHVHHLRPLSEVGESHSVDPVHDLRPVCPNCHGALHSRNPAFSVEEITGMMRKRSAAPGPGRG